MPDVLCFCLRFLAIGHGVAVARGGGCVRPLPIRPRDLGTKFPFARKMVRHCVPVPASRADRSLLLIVP